MCHIIPPRCYVSHLYIYSLVVAVECSLHTLVWKSLSKRHETILQTLKQLYTVTTLAYKRSNTVPNDLCASAPSGDDNISDVTHRKPSGPPAPRSLSVVEENPRFDVITSDVTLQQTATGWLTRNSVQRT